MASWREQEYLEGWQRARAELDNFRKRIEEQRNKDRDTLKREVAEPLLVLLDNMDVLITHVPLDAKDDSWVQGVVHVARQFDQVMKEYGVSVIDSTEGNTFDPSMHEAVERVKKKGARSGMIVEVVQRGYRMGNVVIRPARVKVAK